MDTIAPRRRVNLREDLRDLLNDLRNPAPDVQGAALVFRGGASQKLNELPTGGGRLSVVGGRIRRSGLISRSWLSRSGSISRSRLISRSGSISRSGRSRFCGCNRSRSNEGRLSRPTIESVNGTAGEEDMLLRVNDIGNYRSEWRNDFTQDAGPGDWRLRLSPGRLKSPALFVLYRTSDQLEHVAAGSIAGRRARARSAAMSAKACFVRGAARLYPRRGWMIFGIRERSMQVIGLRSQKVAAIGAA